MYIPQVSRTIVQIVSGKRLFKCIGDRLSPLDMHGYTWIHTGPTIIERNKHFNPSESITLHGHLQSMVSGMGIMNTFLLTWESVSQRNGIADR